jgi:transposase
MKSSDVIDVCKRLMNIPLLSVQHISSAIGVARQTIWRWFTCFFERLQMGRKPKLNRKQEDEVCMFACENPCTSLSELSLVAERRFGVRLSVATISRLLKRNGVTRKKGTACFSEQKPELVTAFVSSLPCDACDSWSSLDEASFALNLAPVHGYAKKGHRVVIRRPGSRGQRLSLLLYISPCHPPQFKLLKGGVKSTNFQEFLSLLPSRDTIVLDNASIHHANKSLKKLGKPTIDETATANSQVLKYLPPYTPQLNPTELAFNVLRHHVRKVSPRTEGCLLKAITSKLNDMTFSGFFRHCWKRDDNGCLRWQDR